MRISEFWKPLSISILLTPICLFLAVVSAGAGHGSYLLAKILFPLSMLSAAAFNSITTLSMIFAVIQFPLYGLILGMAANRGRLRTLAALLSVTHALAVVFSLLAGNNSFS
jgi:hypothetical protein